MCGAGCRSQAQCKSPSHLFVYGPWFGCTLSTRVCSDLSTHCARGAEARPAPRLQARVNTHLARVSTVAASHLLCERCESISCTTAPVRLLLCELGHVGDTAAHAGWFGACSITLQPLDVVKTRMQAAAVGGQSVSMLSAAKQMVAKEGVRSLWAGVGPACIRLSAGAGLYFVVLNKLRQAFDADGALAGC